MLFNQCQPLLRDVGRFDRTKFPGELNISLRSNQMELANRDFHHSQFYAVEGLVLEVDEKSVERGEPIVGNESLIVDRCEWLAANLGRG